MVPAIVAVLCGASVACAGLDDGRIRLVSAECGDLPLASAGGLTIESDQPQLRQRCDQLCQIVVLLLADICCRGCRGVALRQSHPKPTPCPRGLPVAAGKAALPKAPLSTRSQQAPELILRVGVVLLRRQRGIAGQAAENQYAGGGSTTGAKQLCVEEYSLRCNKAAVAPAAFKSICRRLSVVPRRALTMLIRRSNRLTSRSAFLQQRAMQRDQVFGTLAFQRIGRNVFRQQLLSQSSSSDVDGFFLMRAARESAKNSSSASRSKSLLQLRIVHIDNLRHRACPGSGCNEKQRRRNASGSSFRYSR